MSKKSCFLSRKSRRITDYNNTLKIRAAIQSAVAQGKSDREVYRIGVSLRLAYGI